MPFNKEDRINDILAGFKKTDQFYSKFKAEFESDVFDIILDFYPHFKQKDVLNEMIQMYASETLSATEAVLDKDNHYPEYRKLEEIEYMNKILAKEKGMYSENEFSEALHNRIKAIVVKHYSDVMDLSNHGFRLLERNLKMYLLGFVSQFESFVK